MEKPAQNHIFHILLAAAILVFLAALNFFLGWTIGGDSEWYIAAAEGRLNELIEPYSGRFLFPFVVGALDRYLPLDLPQVFLIVTVASIFLFFIVTIALLKDVIRFPFLVLPLFLLPYFFNSVREFFQPDAFYLSLTALFFLALRYEKNIQALFALFLLFLTRESTVVLGVIFAAINWFKSRKLLAIAACAVIVMSFYMTAAFRDLGKPNIHGLSSPVYMVFKFSYNFANNVLGVRPWINTHENCEPLIRFSLPESQSLGNVKEIGFCGFDFSVPLNTLIVLSTIFGVSPLVVFYVIMKRRDVLKKLPPWLLLALIYGLTHYFIGVFAGTGIQRIIGYSWPAFLLVAPFLIQKFFISDRRFVLKLAALHLLVAWLPFALHRTSDSIFIAIAVILLVAVGYYYTLRLVKNQAVAV